MGIFPQFSPRLGPNLLLGVGASGTQLPSLPPWPHRLIIWVLHPFLPWSEGRGPPTNRQCSGHQLRVLQGIWLREHEIPQVNGSAPQDPPPPQRPMARPAQAGMLCPDQRVKNQGSPRPLLRLHQLAGVAHRVQDPH